MKKFIFILMCLPMAGWAQCSSEQHRQFDFWLGQWQVFTPGGKLAGSNTISGDLGACVLKEHYVTASGYEGRSLNIYDKQQGKWHQTWTDNTGLLLQLDGELRGDTMVLQGPGKDPQGNDVLHKISWSPKNNGAVRQHWQISPDQGKSWQTAFDGLYKKLPKRG